MLPGEEGFSLHIKKFDGSRQYAELISRFAQGHLAPIPPDQWIMYVKGS